MNCPLILNNAGNLGTVNYLKPCECLKLCDLTDCKYQQCGIIIQINSVGATGTDTVSIQASACGGSMPLVAASTGALVTVSQLTAGNIYRVYPQNINGILRGAVAEL
jgi:hypothetical protein